MYAESETDEILRWPMRPAEEPVKGANEARLDEGGPLRDAWAAGGRERSRERLEATLIRFSVCSLIRARLGSGKVDLGGQRTTQGVYQSQDKPALLDFTPQHGDGLLILLALVCGELEVILHPDALLGDMIESLSQAFFPCLCFRELLCKGIAFFGRLGQGQTKLGNDRGEDMGIEGLWPRGIWRVGEGLGLELSLELEREVYGCRTV